MDFDRIKLLLDVFHGTLNMVGMDNIRSEAVAELKLINEGFWKTADAPKSIPAQPRLPLEVKERRV